MSVRERDISGQALSDYLAASALQSFMLGAGYPTEVGFWTRSFPMPTRLTSTSVLNSANRKAWRENGPTGGRDLWEMHGVWGYDMQKKAGVVLRENYFVRDPMTNKPVSFLSALWRMWRYCTEYIKSNILFTIVYRAIMLLFFQ